MLSALRDNEKATRPMRCEIPSKRRRLEARLDGTSELDLVYPFYGLEYDAGSGSGGITASPPLSLDSSTKILTLAYKNPLGLDENQLTLLLDSTGPITVTGSGLNLRIDSTAFTIQDGTLTLKQNPSYLSPYTILQILPPGGLNGAYAVVASSFGTATDTKTWNVGYYVYAVSSGGMVNAVVNMQIQRTNMTTAGKSSLTEGINFTFILCYFGTVQPEANLSLLHAPTVTPSTNTYYFVPHHIGKSTTNSPDFITLPRRSDSGSTDWYIPVNSPWMQQRNFVPISTNSEDKWGTATLGYAPGNIDQELDVDDVIILTVNMPQTSGGNWYDASETTDRLTTGPLSFSYQGYVSSPVQFEETDQ